MSALLEVDKLELAYGQVAVCRDISLRLDRGEIVALIGANGAGKSTISRLLFRFFRTVLVPNLGRVGQDLRAMEEELAASGLDWYALRPVKLTDGPLTRNVQASTRFTMKTISRADAAWHIVNLAEDPAPSRS